MLNEDDSYPADWTPEMIRQDIVESGLNPDPTCWSDSGINPIERAVLRRTAERYPDGAYAAFVRLMDEGEHNRATTEGTNGS
jgi:hypothetical protein